MEGDSRELNQTLSPSIDNSVGDKETQDFITPWAKVHLILGISSIIFTIFLMDISSINYKNLISPGLYLITGVIGMLSPITSQYLPFMILLIVLFAKSLINIGLYLALISIVTYSAWEIFVFLILLIVNASLMVFNFLAFVNSRKSCESIFS